MLLTGTCSLPRMWPSGLAPTGTAEAKRDKVDRDRDKQDFG